MYTIGTLIYLTFANAPIAARLLDYFTVFEIILIPALIAKTRHKYLVPLSTILVFSLFSMIFIKDLNSFTYEQAYYEKGFTNYRYFHIYDREEKNQYKPFEELEFLL